MKPFLIIAVYLTLFSKTVALAQDEAPVARPAVENCSSLLSIGLRETADFHLQRLRYYLTLPRHLTEAFVSNMKMIIELMELVKRHPMPGGLIPHGHPWTTGLNPDTQSPIWYQNVIYSIEADQPYRLSDQQLLHGLGTFLKGQVARSAATAEHPQGLLEYDESFRTLRRMPHAVNYIHGSSHYNSGWIILNDFKDAYQLFSDRRFLRDLRHFVKMEQRELIIVFRNSDYDPQAYGQLSLFLRTILPWYSNVNGPQEQVHWGNRTAVTAINMITGEFTNDLKTLLEPNGHLRVSKPPVEASKYFRGPYRGTRESARLPERLLSRAIQFRVEKRDPQKGTLFFVDKKRLERTKRLRELATVLVDHTVPRRIEDFYGQPIAVFDLSMSMDSSGRVPLPTNFDPKHDIIYALKSDDTGHTFLIAGDKELHASVAFRRETKVLAADPGSIRASVYLVIKGLPEEVVRKTESAINEMAGTHSICCVAGVDQALQVGADIQMPEGRRTGILPIRTLRRIIENGFRTTSGQRLQVEIYTGSAESVESLFERLKVQDAKLLMAYPLLVPIGHVLDEIAPAKRIIR